MEKYLLLLAMLPAIGYIICSLIGWHRIFKAMYDEKSRKQFERMEKKHIEMMKSGDYLK